MLPKKVRDIFGKFGGFSALQEKNVKEQVFPEGLREKRDFLLQNLQRYIRESSAIEMDSGVIASTVKLRTKETSKDPTLIYLANDLVYLQEGNGAPFLLTNNKVKVQKLEFEKIVNESGHDSLRVNVLLAYNTDNPKLQITRSAQIVIPRISTVVFDSNLLPNSNKTYSLGSINSRWRDLTLAEDFLIGVNGGSLIMGTGTLIEPTDYLLIFTSGVNALRVASSGRSFLGGLLTVANLNADPVGSRGALYYNSLSQKIRAYQDNQWTYLVQAVTGTDRWELSGADIFATKEKSGQPLRVNIPDHNAGNIDLSVLGNIYSALGGFKFIDGKTISLGRNTIVSTSSNEISLVNAGYSNIGNFVQPAYTAAEWMRVSAGAFWSVRDGHQVVNFNDFMYVLGYDFGNDVWLSSNGSVWNQVTITNGWTTRSDYSSFVFDNGTGLKMWVVGGCRPNCTDGTGYDNDVWYSSDGAIWTKMGVGSRAWLADSMAAVVLNGRMWLLGGKKNLAAGSNSNNSVYYSLSGLDWTLAPQTSPSKWVPRYGHAAVIFNSQIWVMGGADSSGVYYNDVWYSNDGSAWTQALVSAPWISRNYISSLVYNNKMWVIGGLGSASTLYNDVWYSSDGNIWTSVVSSASWAPRYTKTTNYDNKIWILGGGGLGAGNYNDIWYAKEVPTTTYYWYQK